MAQSPAWSTAAIKVNSAVKQCEQAEYMKRSKLILERLYRASGLTPVVVLVLVECACLIHSYDGT